LFGLLGVFWSAAWWKWFRDNPAHHPGVNAAELKIIQQESEPAKSHSIPWRRLVSANLLYVCLTYFAFGYGLYFYLTWLPTYLREGRGFSASAASWLSSIVLLSGAAASVLGGVWTDRWSRKYGLKTGRCGVAAIALAVSGAALAAAAVISSPLAAAFLLAAAAGIADLAITPAWSVCHDIGGEYAGTVTGCMNTFANVGGAIAPVAMGYLVSMSNSWTIPIVITAVIYVAGAVIALLIDPNKKL
jgi:MFS family permease